MPNFTATIVKLSEKEEGPVRAGPVRKSSELLRARRCRRRAAAAAARKLNRRLDRRLVRRRGGGRHGAKPVPAREAEEQQDQHDQRDERRRQDRKSTRLNSSHIT